MHSLVQKILGTCERVANKFLHRGANYAYMYNLHTVCKSAHVNGAYDLQADVSFKPLCLSSNEVIASYILYKITRSYGFMTS